MGIIKNIIMRLIIEKRRMDMRNRMIRAEERMRILGKQNFFKGQENKEVDVLYQRAKTPRDLQDEIERL